MKTRTWRLRLLATFGTIAAIFLFFVLPANAGVVTAGALASTSPTDCSATASNDTSSLTAEDLLIKATYSITEDNTRFDKWNVTLKVTWGDWPGKDDLVDPWEEGPGDDETGRDFFDNYGNPDSFVGSLSLSWESSAFQRDGQYTGTATIGVKHWDKKDNNADDSTYQLRCNDDDSATITINWDTSTGSGMAIVME